MGRQLYPILLDVTDRHVVVVGGGAVAERKIRGLLECDAAVRVVAPAATEGLARLAAKGAIEWLRREFHPADVQKAFLVFAATGDRAVNHRVCQVCDYEEIPVCRVDSPEASEFIVPATLRRGKLTLAVSTGGVSPTLGQRIRDRLAEEFGEEYAGYLDALEKARLRVQREIADPAQRAAVLRALSDDDEVLALVKAGRAADAEQRLADIIERR